MKILIKYPLLILALFICSWSLFINAAIPEASGYGDHDEENGADKFYDVEKGEGILNDFFKKYTHGSVLALKDDDFDQQCTWLQGVAAFNKANVWQSLKAYIDQSSIDSLKLYLGGTDLTLDDGKKFMKSLIELSFQCKSLKLIEIRPKDGAFDGKKHKVKAIDKSISILGSSIQELIPALIQSNDGATIDVVVKAIKFGEYEIPIVCVTGKKKEANKVVTAVSSVLSSALGIGITLIGQYLAELTN